ncbi:MAG TPA: Mut7-C RNAse domain-containing protein [Acidobacteriota bacterium]|nr:Mut7-C RNAse domain-containing protein [Acidobacteriota bacterium]
MKFVADVMLGRLARLMRFDGYDVEYDPKFGDEELLKRSRSRILLTRDRDLAARASKNRAYFVQSTGAEIQLEEIQNNFPQADGNHATRCLVCNCKIRIARKSKIEHLVPPFVFKRHHEFYFCHRCRRVYWKGTHFERMMRMVE